MRSFNYSSLIQDGNLALALAPALTPEGINPKPHFFSGYAAYPQVVARGLLVLGDITATRYFKFVPDAQRDPVLSAQGDRLRAECFSACNGVYARLDLLQNGLEGDIRYGTTNVDIRMELRNALTSIKQKDSLFINIGDDGLKTVHLQEQSKSTNSIQSIVHEKPVLMPDRWVRALGNTAEIHHTMQPVFSLTAPQAQMFVSALPHATGKQVSGWVTPTPTGAKIRACGAKNAVYISGFHRLSALKRVMTNITGMVFYAPINGESGQAMVEASLPGARLTLSLTAEAWQGYSGEGSLLASLAQGDVLEDADAIGTGLGFQAVIDELRLAQRWNVSKERVNAALALLAVSGKLGYDAHDGAYFHRELPADPDRVLKDNPRLNMAKKLVDRVEKIRDNQWLVDSGDTQYRVTWNPEETAQQAKCTCTWYLNHQNKRGPCKHILAVQLKEERYEP